VVEKILYIIKITFISTQKNYFEKTLKHGNHNYLKCFKQVWVDRL